jgi:hypothetical protein
MTNSNGRILYEGPSMLDGAPIICIATGFSEVSENDKTGGMIQTWIMRADLPPHHAFKSDEGASVCGDCVHRLLQSCYVKWWAAPLSVWNCWHHGAGYDAATPEDFDEVALRIGSCGDPAAVPAWVWAPLLPRIASRTGYTHQWRDPRFSWFRGRLQASCDNEQDLIDARAAGWRPFLVQPAGSPAPAGTVHCAASTERGNKTTCARCGLCDGDSADVIIWTHGSCASRFDNFVADASPIQEQVAA